MNAGFDKGAGDAGCVRVRDVVRVLESFAPLSLQEDWDNSGLSVGDPDSAVRGVLVALDCTPAVLREAAERGADMVVTHHPLVFSPLKRIVAGDPVGDMVLFAVRNGISVYSAHTSADKAEGGVNHLMAARLGLSGTERFDESGIGLVGWLPEPCGLRAFAELLKERFGLSVVRMGGLVSEGSVVRKVAVCGGSGSSMIAAARAAGADAYVTGDVGYHRFFPDAGLAVFDIGHYEGEVEIVDRFVSLLKENFVNFAVYRTELNINPVYYI